MFNMGFWELVTVLLVALIVFSPEKLPHLSKTLGILFGKAHRAYHNLKNDIQKEMSLEDSTSISEKKLSDNHDV